MSLLLLFSCKPKVKDQQPSQTNNSEIFNNYIVGHSQGLVSRCNDIYVHLGFKIPDSVKINNNLMTISPIIGGEIILNENRDRVSIVGANIKHNVKYKLKFNIGDITEIPKGMETFEFNFEAKRQAWNLTVNAPVSKSMKTVDITGKIKYELCEPNPRILEDALKATQDGKSLSINWDHNKNKRYSDFKIINIERKDDPGEVDLKLSMAPLNIKDEANMKVNIPSKSDFSFHSYKIVSNQHVEVNFTDPIKVSQILDGLISVKGRKINRIKIINNTVHVYFKYVEYGNFELKISPGIKNIANFPLKDSYTRKLFFAPLKPVVKIAEQGNILPPSGNWELPVSIVSASGFRMRILKVYEKNAHRFFQENGGELSYQKGLENIGRIVLDTTFSLNKKDVFKTTTHSIVLDKQIRKEKGALYKVFLSIPLEYNNYPCDDRKISDEKDRIDNINFDKPYITYYYGYDDDYDYYEEDYYGSNNVGNRTYTDPDENSHRYLPNPCSNNYQKIIHDQRLLICTDIGLVIKSEPNANRFFAYVSHITSSKPIAGATVAFYDFQGKKLGQSISNGSGFASINTKEVPYLARANYNGQYTYLTVNDAKALSMSTFQVEGKNWGGNDKVFFYGDRDVWRPGDTVFLSSIVFNKEKAVPKNLPIKLSLFDPTNKLVKKWIVRKNYNGLYDCRFHTDMNDATGYWRIEMKLGGKVYFHDVRIETVRPNRLKIEMAFNNPKIIKNGTSKDAPITVKWMHGLPAKDLRVVVGMIQKSLQNPFGANFKNYSFDDIRKYYDPDLGFLEDGLTNEDGVFDFVVPTDEDESYPSMMLFNFEVKAYEKGGAFSTDLKSIKYSPYKSYVGAKFPQGATQNEIYLKTTEAINLVCLNEDGKSKSGTATIKINKINSQWWYQFGTRGDYSALQNNIQKLVKSYKLNIPKSGTAISINQEGHFLVTITDDFSGHTVSRIVYSYKNNYWSDGGDAVAELEVLPFLIDKDEYKVGDFLEFNLPAIPNGHFLITVESGGKIVYKESRQSSRNPVSVNIYIDEDMAPTAYVHVHFIQAWKQHNHDRPLRLFGVKPIKVYDSSTILNPEIEMVNEIRADKDFEISISEKDGKPISYTLAVVDEGLLDITQFHTPNPWSYFFSKEGLTIKTWDIYRDIFQRFLGEYSSLLAVGGDGVSAIKPSAKAQRFKPAVKFVGPFTLGSGEVKTHKFNIKDYVGSVRVMVVATNGKAFGRKEKTVPVKKPLMLYATLPRVLGPGEILKVPVTVFAMDDKVREVDVKIATNNQINVDGDATSHLSFQKNGEKDMFFIIKIPNKIGLGKVTIEAKSGQYFAKESIDIDVRPSSAIISKTVEDIIPKNSKKSIAFEPIGMDGTRNVKLTLSRGLNFSFEPFVEKLSNYPHGCLEQTVSSTFPQIYLYKMNILKDEAEEMAYRQKYSAAIQKLRYMQLPNGGFSYWAGGNYANSWGTSYALEFLLEAKKYGYKVPDDMLEKLISYQYKAADNWKIKSGNSSRYYSARTQAYCLYTLAKAGKPNYAALNRLRLVPQLGTATKWLLGHALLLVGEKNSANKIIKDASTSVDKYKELGGSFGSSLRDQALILRILLERGEKLKAKRLVDEMMPYFKGESNIYLSTQEISQSLISFALFSESLDKINDELVCDVTLSEKQSYKDQKIKENPKDYKLSKKSIENKSISINNKGTSDLFASISISGLPIRDESAEEEQDLSLSINYYEEDGTPIDPTSITKGSDFVVEFIISHKGERMDYENMALSAIFPSGWEIINSRLYDTFEFDVGSDFDYQDIRDDRVYTYFDLVKGQKKTFRFKVNASYEGKYWAPAVFCEAMYDPSIRAKSKGFWAEVKSE